MTDRTCEVEGCDKKPRSGSAALCPMHYHRQYRHGSVQTTAGKGAPTVTLGRRYRTAHRPFHPVAPPSGRVYVHRVVLYDAIGPGPHRCRWCPALVDWLPRGRPDALQVDHLNDDGSDNRRENLVPACASCNTLRGQQRKHDALVAAGWWSQHDTVARLRNGGRRPLLPQAS